MKKLMSVFVAALFAFSAFSGIASAETVKTDDVKIKSRAPKGGFIPAKAITERVDDAEEPMLFSTATGSYNYWEVYNYIETQLSAKAPRIQMWSAGYRIPSEEGSDIYRKVLYDNYDIFVLDFGYTEKDSELWVNSAGYVSYIVPGYYHEDLEEGEAGAVEFIEEKIDEYLDLVEDIPSDDVVGKLLVIHDALCADITYAEEELAEEGTTGRTNNHLRTVYDTFKSGRTVCQGYALTFKAVCDALNERLKEERMAAGASTGGSAAGSAAGSGTAYTSADDIIETSFCTFSAVEESGGNLGHIWNVVKIDGKWYHVDLTWADMDGEVYYNDPKICSQYDYFLRTDNEYMYPADPEYMSSHMAAEGHDWVFYTDEPVTCQDTEYSSGYIFNRVYYGQITYSDGLYNIDYQGWRFRSGSVIATEVLATDPFYDDDYGGSAIMLLVEQPVTFTQRIVSYTDGAMTYNSGPADRTVGTVYNLHEIPVMNTSPGKLLLWKPNTFEPLCRAIDLPVITAATAE